MILNRYAVFVNTTDSFDDCWVPFFTLFKKYWPNFNGNIYLNTESKSFQFDGLNIISIQNSKFILNKKLTWSECLIGGLKSIDEDIILYMQEDYFLKSNVEFNKVNEIFNIMVKNDIDCIHLTDQNSPGPFQVSQFKDLWKIDNSALYRVSCQAAFWKKDVLISYIRPYESPWQFEKFGTKRSKKLNHEMFTLNREIYMLSSNEIMPYVFTGIIKGCWKKEVVKLFEVNDIYVDFSRRGFFEDYLPKNFWIRLKNKIIKIPSEIRSYIEIFKL